MAAFGAFLIEKETLVGGMFAEAAINAKT